MARAENSRGANQLALRIRLKILATPQALPGGTRSSPAHPTFSAALALILAALAVSASASLSSRSQSPQLFRQLARIHALAAHGVACARWSSCLASSAQPLKSSKGANGAAGPG